MGKIILKAEGVDGKKAGKLAGFQEGKGDKPALEACGRVLSRCQYSGGVRAFEIGKVSAGDVVFLETERRKSAEYFVVKRSINGLFPVRMKYMKGGSALREAWDANNSAKEAFEANKSKLEADLGAADVSSHQGLVAMVKIINEFLDAGFYPVIQFEADPGRFQIAEVAKAADRLRKYREHYPEHESFLSLAVSKLMEFQEKREARRAARSAAAS